MFVNFRFAANPFLAEEKKDEAILNTFLEEPQQLRISSIQ